MNGFDLRKPGRNVFSLGGSVGLSIVNLSRKSVTMHVNVKRGGTWTSWNGCVTLKPSGRWRVAREQVPAEQLCVVVASGRAGTHPLAVKF
ncbi:MAG: hypothetical protein JO040_00165 [Gemmatimonadetes bacterium]|nr:hypothetical protein [Gemmatimonadota bacterium]